MSDGVPVQIGPDEAREAATRELLDPAYQAAEPSAVERALAWLAERLAELMSGAAAVAPGGQVGVILLALVLLLIVVVIRLRVGGIARTRRRAATVFQGRPRSAEDHRRAAEEARSRGELAVAVRERFRAVVRELERRGVLDELSGRTVGEIAAQAGRTLPSSANMLRAAATIFDDVVYGDRPATVDGYELIAGLDEAVRRERPALVPV